MTSDDQSAHTRLTLKNLKLRRLEDEGEVYEIVEPDVLDEKVEELDPALLNFQSVDQIEHTRDTRNTGLAFWRNERKIANSFFGNKSNFNLPKVKRSLLD